MTSDDDALQQSGVENAGNIVLARQRAVEELIQAKTVLERRTDALTRSLALMQAILESAADPILVTDESTKVTAFNNKFLAMWGVPAEVIGLKPHGELLELASRPFKEPDRLRARIDAIHATSPAETSDLVEFADGAVFEWCSRIQRVEDRTVGRVWHFRDLTESQRTSAALRESGERLRFMAESMPQKIFTALPGGEVNYFNQQWVEFTGLTTEQLQDWRWENLVHPDDLDENQELWRHSALTGEPLRLECRFRQGDGGYRWHVCHAHAMKDAAGRVVMWTGSCTDIDDLKRADEERRQLLESEQSARAEAERTSRIKDEFLATLSHELRTPLNAILGWSQVLRRADKRADMLDQGLDTIERNARMQARLIEDLLDMNRIISGKMLLDVQQVEPVTFINAAVETTRPSAEARGIKLELEIDPTAGRVSGDPNRLQQVVWNLLSNAIKFTPRGGRVQVILKRRESQIEISIVDSGMGIEPDFLPHVFERFRQADASTTRSHGGLGLGLAIVKQLVELQGGAVRVQSPGKDRGSTFTVLLPLAAVYRAPRDATSMSRAATLPDGGLPDLSGVKVLVVDDEVDCCNLIRQVLAECQADVLVAHSAEEAIQLVEGEQPHVLVSDIGMPGVDGYELLRRVRGLGRARGGRIPAVALTAFARSEDRTRALLAGFAVHLAKPIEPLELVATVASVTGRMHQGEAG